MQGVMEDEEDDSRADVSGEIRLPATLEIGRASGRERV